MPLQPIQVARSCIRRARRFLDLADERKLPTSQVKNDLRRMAAVMAVAAVDAYVHCTVIGRVSDVRYAGELPKSLARVDVPFAELASLADASIRARQDGIATRPWVQVKNALQRQLLRETFQSFDQVGNALSMIGISKAWKRIGANLGESAGTIKTRLDALVYRRNQIVHEGDVARGLRLQKLRFNDIDRTDVRSGVDWIERLITAMDAVIHEDL